jgi:hypothetical protein
LEGSIDFLEAEYQRLLKEIDAVADETLRGGLQDEAEKVRIEIRKARNELVALLVATDEEILKNSLSAIDRRTQLELEANKERFKEISVQEAQAVVIVKKAEEDKLVLEQAFLKKRFEEGLDKTGEYYNKTAELEAKAREIKKAEQARELAVFANNGEKEVNIKLETLRRAYDNDEDFAKAKELLYLELEANKIAFNAEANKFISASDEKTFNELQVKIRETRASLNESVFNRGETGTANFKFNQAFNERFGDGNLTPKEIKEIADIETESEFEKDKKILENKLSNELLFSSERISLEKQLNELILRNQEKQYNDKKEKEQKVWDIINQGADIATQVSDKIFDYERAQLEAKAESELETIDTLYAARLKAAEGNASETARLEQEYQLKKTAQEKKAAEQRRQIALKEASINLALSVLKAAPDLLLMGVAAVTGAIQIATIRAQKFSKGGYTGFGKGRPDETGHVPVGIVHDGEYVIPKWQVNKNPNLIRSIERDRKRGFASGGLATQGISMESFVVMADIIAQRVAAEVSAATYQGTMMGSERGTSGGLTRAVRETNSRNSAKIINTF